MSAVLSFVYPYLACMPKSLLLGAAYPVWARLSSIVQCGREGAFEVCAGGLREGLTSGVLVRTHEASDGLSQDAQAPLKAINWDAFIQAMKELGEREVSREPEGGKAIALHA